MSAAEPSYSFPRRLVHFLAQGFGAGRIPFAPGTFGTLVAVPIYLLLSDFAPGVYAVVVAALFALGAWLAGITGRDLGQHDHPSIVCDEIVGYLVAMFLAPAGWAWMLAGFLLFRLFDIWKPYPIRAADQRLQNGLGCMLDDALAGIYALLVMQLASRALFT